MLIAGGGGEWSGANQGLVNISFITMATTGDMHLFFGELVRSGAGGGTPSSDRL